MKLDLPDISHSVGGAYDALVKRLIRHAACNSPFYQKQTWTKKVKMGLAVPISDIPITRSQDLKDHTEYFYANSYPEEHGETSERFTSGSTGEPTLIKRTAYSARQNALQNEFLKADWGIEKFRVQLVTRSPTLNHRSGTIDIESSGKSKIIYCYDHRPDNIFSLIKKYKPSMFSTIPSVLHSILDLNEDISSIKFISTHADIIRDDLQRKIDKLAGVLHQDIYGSEETGIIAATCNKCGKYHFAHGNSFVEFQKKDIKTYTNENVHAVLLTPLHNYAMPLIRYEIGDFVIMSKDRNCPKNLRSFDRIIGRERDLFKIKDGRTIAAAFDSAQALKLGIRRLKMVQVSYDVVELHYVPIDGKSLTQDDAQAILETRMGKFWTAKPVRVESLPNSRNGKYLMHECLI